VSVWSVSRDPTENKFEAGTYLPMTNRLKISELIQGNDWLCTVHQSRSNRSRRANAQSSQTGTGDALHINGRNNPATD